MVWYGLVWFGMVWYGLVWFGLVWYGLVFFGVVWYALVWLTLLTSHLLQHYRYDVIDHVPGGEELRMCLLTKTSLGNIRRWRQDQCQPVGPFSGHRPSNSVSLVMAIVVLVVAHL